MEKKYCFKSEVPYVKYEGNIVFNPVTASQYGFACFDYYKDKTTAPKLKVILMPIYERLLQEHPNYLYHFPLVKYKMDPSWQSALAYSNVLSFYLRMLQFDSSATVAIKEIILILSRDSILKLKYKNYGIWYEEYPSPTPSLVLNGFVSVIISLYEYLLVFKDNLIEEILEQSIKCLLEMLEYFDNGIYLKYDLVTGHPVQQLYYNPHYYEFRQLYKMTSDANFYKIMGRMKKMKRTMTVFFDFVDALYYCKKADFPNLFKEDYTKKLNQFTRY